MFFSGWDDVNDCLNVNSPSECRWIENRSNYQVALSNNKKYYQYELRKKSNEKYDQAEMALMIIFINHAASMIDALISSKHKSKNAYFQTIPIYDLDNKKVNSGIKFNLRW